MGQRRYQASSFIMLFNNKKALVETSLLKSMCFTKIMVVIWVVKPKGKCALL
jgi:hypothetical protein